MKKAILVIVPIVVIGTILGLGFAGVIQIPGISPAKAKRKAAGMYAQKDDKLALNKTTPPATQPAKPVLKEPSPPKVDPKAVKKDLEKGADALATVWNELSTDELVKITSTWKEEDLATVLTHMETEKVAKLLGQLAIGDTEHKIDPNPTRASKLSKILQDQGAVVKTEAAS